MSRINELINELCPDGVRFKRIDEICSISRGRVISKDYIRDNKGDYPVYSSQTENNGELGKISTYDFEGEFLTWTTDGANAGCVFYRNGKFSVTNVCGLISVKNEDLLSKYLYYILSIEAPKYVNKGMGNPKLMSNVMARIKVPVPPLEVQREIVRVLDSFTLLTAELTAELTARKKQYEYYRDKLLSFNTECRIVRIGEIVSIKRGKRVIKSDLHKDGVYAVYQNSLTPLGYFNEYNTSSNTTFVISAGAAGEVGYSNKPFWAADDCLIFECSNKVHSRYLYYFLCSKQNLIYSKVRKASIPRLSKEVLETLKISVPSLDIQKRIAETLDNFETICNDLNIGLPAEIEARKKQYEFYRDLLLTFAETGDIIAQTDRQTDRQTSNN